jgi:hypothetical protein
MPEALICPEHGVIATGPFQKRRHDDYTTCPEPITLTYADGEVEVGECGKPLTRHGD